MNGARNVFLAPPPGALGRGQKVKYNLISIRGQKQIPSCCLSVMLSPPKPVDEIQPNLVCELLT